MIWWVVISGVAWLAGNILWPYFGDPKFFYVPLAAFILAMLLYIKKSISEREKMLHIIFGSFVVLATGNFIKQLFYSEKIKHINDFWFGGLTVAITLILILRQWETQKHKVKKSGS